MSEEKVPPPHMYDAPETALYTPPLSHRDGSLEHEYRIDVSPDLPAIRLRIFIFPGGDARVEAEFEQSS
jgi:hypothetical protein